MFQYQSEGKWQEEYLRKVCLDIVNPAIVTVSWARTPSTEPMPYWMLTGPLLPGDVKDEDLFESYSGVPEVHRSH
jgi:hypothetical protein